MVTVEIVSAGTSTASASTELAMRMSSATDTTLRLHAIEGEFRLLDLKSNALQMMESFLNRNRTAAVEDLVSRITQADALIISTPILNASYSPLLKLLVDIIGRDDLRGKPVVLAGTGGSDRHCLALDLAVRPLLTYMKCAVTSTSVFSRAPLQRLDEELHQRIHQAAEELAASIARNHPRRVPSAQPVTTAAG